MSANRIDLFRKTMALEEVDEVLVIPSVSEWVSTFSGIPLKELLFNPEAIVSAQTDAQEAAGYDALFAYVDPLYIPEAFGCPLLLRSSGADVSPLDIRNKGDAGALRIPSIRKDGRLPLLLDVADQLVHLPRRKVPVLGFAEGPVTTVSRILGAQKMGRALIQNRLMVNKVIEKVNQLLLIFGRTLRQIGVDALMMADPVSSSALISPKIYAEFVLPSLKQLIQNLRIPVILHLCGDTRPILNLMAETGARILSLDQCMDLAQAKGVLAGRCGIGGNVDPIHALSLGTPEDVKRETLRCLLQGGKKGFILMAGCDVPAGTPLENLKTMVKVARSDSSRPIPLP